LTCRRGDSQRRRHSRRRRPQQELAGDHEHQQRNDACKNCAPPVERNLGHVANRRDNAVTRL